MAKPYREGKGWSVRLRVSGHDLYLSGFTSEAAARRAAEARRADILTNPYVGKRTFMK